MMFVVLGCSAAGMGVKSFGEVGWRCYHVFSQWISQVAIVFTMNFLFQMIYGAKCDYCGQQHGVSECGTRLLDERRRDGYFVDFPEERAANAAAGLLRLAQFERRSSSSSAGASTDVDDSEAGARDGGADGGGRAGWCGAATAEGVGAQQADSVPAAPAGVPGGVDGGVIYYARTKNDLLAGYPRRQAVAELAERTGARLVPAHLRPVGERLHEFAGLAPARAIAGGGGAGGGGGQSSAAGGAGAAVAGGRPEPRLKPKRVASRGGGVKKRATQAAYYRWFDAYVGIGKASREADLWAKAMSCREECCCRTCEVFDVEMMRPSLTGCLDFTRGGVSANLLMWAPSRYHFLSAQQFARCGNSINRAWSQYVDASDCEFVRLAQIAWPHLAHELPAWEDCRF